MPNHWTLRDMAAAVRKRDLSPVELLEAHLRQIETHNPRVNAFTALLAEEAREAARRAEAAAAKGEAAGPLHGVPLTVKDSFDVQGTPTLCGSRLRLGRPAARDSTAVSRLRAAGAIILGKTNCPEFLMNYETDNHVTGRTNNPWNLDLTPGGSSGGEAAAIAACFSAGGVGSDGGGSIRLPAHFCGVCGLKPTPGRVSASGHFPVICHPGGLLGVAGPMARTARDVQLLFQALAGYDPEDPFSAPVPLRTPRVQGIRVGVAEQFYEIPVQAPLGEAVRSAAAALARIGFAVEPFMPRGLERAPNLWSFFFCQLPAGIVRDLTAGRESETHWTGREMFDAVKDLPEPSGKTVLEQLAARDAMRAALMRQMSDVAVLLWPASGVTAFPHRRRRWETPGKSIGYFEAMFPLTPANLLGLPAVVIPFSTTVEGIPVGVQLIGRPYEEELILEIAGLLEEARGPFPGPPGF
ncbi:MAG: amidase [Bryobacteraceae bacterium]|nr:amidase [Bryobacteraceae bacterium]